MKLPTYCKLFGYYRILGSEKDWTRLQNLIFVERIVAYPAENASFYIPRSQKARLMEAAKKRHLVLSCSELLGAPCLLKRYRTRIGIPLGMIFAAVLLYFGTHTVWRVEVHGNEKVSAYEVCEGLRELGFGVGADTENNNYDELIAAFRLKNPRIAWMGIYTQGTTAHVRVIENKEITEKAENPSFPSHLVSDSDGVILRVETTAGTAVVRSGDVVKAGDALVLGWMKGAQNDRILSAEGRVIARVSDTIRVRVPYEAKQKNEVKRAISQISVNFFEKRINIFKKTNTNATDYVIIEKSKPFRLPNGLLLPFSISVNEVIQYDQTMVTLAPMEAALRAKEELESRIRQAVGEGELLFRRVWEEQSVGEYVLCATIEYTRNIAVSAPFTVN